MRIVSPLTITESELIASNITEDDAPDWVESPSPAYDTGDEVIYEHKVYESLEDNNSDRPDTGAAETPPTWLSKGATNRYRMFDQQSSAISQRTGSIDVTVQPTAVVTAAALISVTGISATLQVITADDGVVYSETKPLQNVEDITDWYAYFFDPIEQRNDVVFLNIPIFRDAQIRVVITGGSSVAQLGELVLGAQRVLGDTVYGTSVGIRDFSTKDEDQFGNTVITRRRFRKRVDYDLMVQTARIASVQRALALARSAPTLFIGDPSREETIAFGFYRDFNIVIDSPNISPASIEVESLTIAESDPFYSDAAVSAPEILVPLFGEDAPENTIFRTSAFAVIPAGEDSHAETDWQIADSQSFSNVLHESLNDAVNLTEYVIPDSPDHGMTVGGEYWVRARHYGTTSGAGAWAAPVKFVLGGSATVDTPSITVPIESPQENFELDNDFESSAFSVTPSSDDDHESSDWQIATDAAFANVVSESLADETNLTSWPPPLADLTPGNDYFVRVRHNGRLTGASSWSDGVEFTATAPASQQEYTAPGTYSFTVPGGITEIATVVVGAGADGEFATASNVGTEVYGGGGGGLRYRNSIPVTPGETLTIAVGEHGENGGNSSIKRGATTLIYAQGGQGRDGGVGTAIGGNVGGGNGAGGGYGRVFSTGLYAGGGGAAGGYSDDGNSESGGAPKSGGNSSTSASTTVIGTGGGGVGLQGEGASGATSGEGGSGGANGTNAGGAYGGGGPGYIAPSASALSGADGAVRIIWGSGRSFPSTNTADV